MTFSLVTTEKKINNLDFGSNFEFLDSEIGETFTPGGRNANHGSPLGSPNQQSLGSFSHNMKGKNSNEVNEGKESYVDDYKELDYNPESDLFLDSKLSTPQYRSKNVSAFYTVEAPRELISFLYKLRHEAKKHSKSINLKHLPDDLPIPDGLSWDHSIGSDLMFGSMTRSSSSNFLRAGSNFRRSSSFYSGNLLRGSRTGSLLNPNWLCLEPVDSVVNSMDSLKIQRNSSSSKKGLNEIRLSDVNSLHSLSSGCLNSTEFTVDDSAKPCDKGLTLPVSKAIDKVYLRDYPKHKKIRSNSTDFAFSEANEASRIEMSTATTPKAIKEFLIPEENEEKEDDLESLLMRFMKNHLRCGRRRRIISRSMLKKNVERHEERRRQLARISLKPTETLRQAVKQDYDLKIKSKRSFPRSSNVRPARERIPVIDEEDLGSSLSLLAFDKE